MGKKRQKRPDEPAFSPPAKLQKDPDGQRSIPNKDNSPPKQPQVPDNHQPPPNYPPVAEPVPYYAFTKFTLSPSTRWLSISSGSPECPRILSAWRLLSPYELFGAI